MKLLIVLLLAALPLLCYAGSGCADMENVIAETLDSNVSESQYIEDLQQFIPGERTEMALRKFKRCFNDQNEETLSNVGVLADAIYNSKQCAGY